MVGSREEAEDIAQDTFLIAYRELENLRKDDQLESWIYRIARNQVYQTLRRVRGVSYGLDDEQGEVRKRLQDLSPAGNPEKVLLKEELNQVIALALKRLPEKLREVFILAVMQQLSYKEICEIVGKSLPAVKTDIYRARLLAKEELSHYIKCETPPGPPGKSSYRQNSLPGKGDGHGL
jgi:RNA polymerase sigma-70 factor (ECF subfamily)